VLKQLTGVPAGIQALEAVGTVTADDYKRVFAPLVDQARRTGSRMRLLYQFGPGFQRITPGALWADTRLGVGYARVLDGCAVVSDIDWIRTPTRRIGTWMPCPVRVYDNDERDDAVAWLTSLPEGADVPARDMAKAYIGGVSAALGSLGELVISKGAKNRHRAR
jgi:SpoIIAA-like